MQPNKALAGLEPPAKKRNPGRPMNVRNRAPYESTAKRRLRGTNEQLAHSKETPRKILGRRQCAATAAWLDIGRTRADRPAGQGANAETA